MNNRFKMTIGAGLTALAVLVAGGGYYHYHVRTDTPGFAIETVARALEEHNVQEFNRVVDASRVIDSGYDGFVEGLTADDTSTPEVKDAIKNFTQMFRAPIVLSVKEALDSYVASGELKTEGNAGVREILERTGLNGVELRDVKNVQLSEADKNEAFADVIIFQPEIGREFPIQIVMTRGADDSWKVTRMQNFREYVEQVNQARHAQLDDYLAAANDINSAHETKLREAEKNYSAVLLHGSLAVDDTRSELRTMLIDVFLKDWQERKAELNNLHVPREAQPLHNIYMEICDESVAAAQDYADWMDDKNPATIKDAEDKIHHVQSLMEEAAALARSMTTKESPNNSAPNDSPVTPAADESPVKNSKT